MSILKSVGKFVGGTFFTIFLGTLVMVFALTQIVDYSSLKPIATNLISQQLVSQQNVSDEQLNQFHSEISDRCTGETYSLDFQGQAIKLNCSEVKSSTPQDLVKVIAGSAFDNVYNKQYDCEFLQCLQQPGGMEKYLVILSPKSQQFFKGILNYILIGAIFSGIILFASIDGTVGRLKAFGSCFVAVGVSYFILPATQNLVPVPAEAKAIVGPITNQILGSTQTNLLIILVVGVVLFGAGYFLERKEKSEKK